MIRPIRTEKKQLLRNRSQANEESVIGKLLPLHAHSRMCILHVATDETLCFNPRKPCKRRDTGRSSDLFPVFTSSRLAE